MNQITLPARGRKVTLQCMHSGVSLSAAIGISATRSNKRHRLTGNKKHLQATHGALVEKPMIARVLGTVEQ